MSESEAFERALVENHDDLAGWCAYADYLAERGDPRGAFMQTQLALEDDTRPKDERESLKAREAELLAEHERAWLGELAPHLLDRTDRDGNPLPGVEYWWGRGFIAEMKVSDLTLQLAQTIAKAPAAKFLRKLHIEGKRSYARGPELFSRTLVPTPPGAERHEAYFELIGAPCMESLRVLQLGEDDEPSPDGWTEQRWSAPGLEHVVASMPRVEELYLLCRGYNAEALFSLPNLTRLQVLRIHGFDEEVPLQALARNPALSALTHLLVHPHSTLNTGRLPLAQVQALVNSPHVTSLSHLQLRLSSMGDEGVRAIIESGILKRLGWLDLRNGTITDSGARRLAEYAATRNLRRLDLSRNQVSNAALAMLKRAGVNVVADNALSRREREALDAEAHNARGAHDPNYSGDERDADME